jgi:Lipocalin-like domain
MRCGTSTITFDLAVNIRRRFNMSAAIFGTWKLISASATAATGKRNDSPFGTSPVGFLTYTLDGRMSAMISYGGRKHLSSTDSSSAPAEEQAEAFRTFVSYGGRFTLLEEKVIHHVEISSIQDWVGTNLIRSIKFQRDRIVLTAPPMSVAGNLQTFELIWQRLSPNLQ